MGLREWWGRLLGREVEPEEPEVSGPTRLPTEPFVFECRDCGKVFEVRRKHPLCPECDSGDVDELG